MDSTNTSPRAGHENSPAAPTLSWSKKLISAPGLPKQYWHLDDDDLQSALQLHTSEQSDV